METVRVNPDGIWGHGGRVFSQAVAPGEGQLVFITGQIAWDAQDRVVGLDDTAEQLNQCFRNTRQILAGLGGTLEDLIAITLYFTNRDDIPAIQATRASWLSLKSAPASNLIQVSGLVIRELSVELVPTALIPAQRYRPPLSN